MEFYTQNGKVRPIRLSEATRRFAADSLGRKYGLDTLKVNSVSLDGIAHFDEYSEIEQYDLAVSEIAAKAPIRLCEGEKISGAATLGLAILHDVPATYHGESVFPGVSHLTVDFETVLKYGVDHIRNKAEQAFRSYRGTEKQAFAKSCLACLDAFAVWHGRYLDALRDSPEYRANYENLTCVPFQPAGNFYEAVPSLWFTVDFLRLCG